MRPFPAAATAAFLLALVVPATVPAAAQDKPAGPAKGDAPAKTDGPAKGDGQAPAAKAPDAPAKKKDRQVDPKAAAAVDRYRKLLHSPANAGVKKLSARGELQIPNFPDAVVVRPSWKAGEEGFRLDFEIPDSVKQMYGPEAVAMMQKTFGGLVNQVVAPLFVDVSQTVDAYDLAAKDEEGGVAVTMVPFDDAKAKQERQVLHFGADGLLHRAVLTPKIDPEDPNAALMAGVDIDVSLTHEKRGERFVTSSFTALLPMGEMKSSATFWDGPGGLPLPRLVSLTLPGMSQEPFSVELWDYVVDEKPVEATAKPKKVAAEEPVVKPVPGKTEPAPEPKRDPAPPPPK